jgi:hypothetical protein
VSENVEVSPFVNVIVLRLTDAVVTELRAKEAVDANDAVPNKLPVKLPVKDPVLYELVKVYILAVKELNELVVTKDPVLIVAPPDPVFTVIGNVVPSPFVKVIVFNNTDAVKRSEPVFVVPPPPDPVSTIIGNVEPSPFVKVIVFKDTDAVNKSDPVLVLPPLMPVSPLPSPLNEPVKDPVAFSSPPVYVNVGTPPKLPPLLYCICPELPPGVPLPPAAGAEL